VSQKLKLIENIASVLPENGITEWKEVQTAAFSKIMGGQDLIIAAEEGAGKSTLIVLAVLNKLKAAYQEAPRALIMLPTKDKVLEMEEKFRFLGLNLDLRVEIVHDRDDIEEQREKLREGVDVVIGTHDRILALSIRSGINFSQIKMFIVDDLHQIIKLNKQVIIKNLTESISKCQYILTTTAITEKVEILSEHLMNNPTYIEIEDEEE